MRALVVLLVSLAACDSDPAVPVVPPAQDVPAATIVAVNTTVPVPGQYTVTGTVVSTYVCPPCPPDALCAPCPPEAVVLGPRGSTAPPVDGDPSYLSIETTLAASFRVGRTYRVSVAVEEVGTDRRATLLGADRLD